MTIGDIIISMKEGSPVEYLGRVAKKIVGIDGIERSLRDMKEASSFDKAERFIAAASSGAAQFLLPISHEGIARSIEPDKKPLFDNKPPLIIFGMLLDLGVGAYVLTTMFTNPELAISAKVAYNTGAAVLPDVIEATQQRFSPQK